MIILLHQNSINKRCLKSLVREKKCCKLLEITLLCFLIEKTKIPAINMYIQVFMDLSNLLLTVYIRTTTLDFKRNDPLSLQVQFAEIRFLHIYAPFSFAI